MSFLTLVHRPKMVANPDPPPSPMHMDSDNHTVKNEAAANPSVPDASRPSASPASFSPPTPDSVCSINKKEWIRQCVELKEKGAQEAQLSNLFDGLGLRDTKDDSPAGPTAWRRRVEKRMKREKKLPPTKSEFRIQAEQEWRELVLDRQLNDQVLAATRRGMSFEEYTQWKAKRAARKGSIREYSKLKSRSNPFKKMSKRAERREEMKRTQKLHQANHDGGVQEHTVKMEQGGESGPAGADVKLAPLGAVNFGGAQL